MPCYTLGAAGLTHNAACLVVRHAMVLNWSLFLLLSSKLQFETLQQGILAPRGARLQACTCTESMGVWVQRRLSWAMPQQPVNHVGWQLRRQRLKIARHGSHWQAQVARLHGMLWSAAAGQPVSGRTRYAGWRQDTQERDGTAAARQVMPRGWHSPVGVCRHQPIPEAHV